MNFADKIKNKGLGFYFAAAAALVSLVALIIFFVYSNAMGQSFPAVIICAILGIVLLLANFFYDGKWAEVLSIAAVVLLTMAFAFTLESGIGNITDAIFDIVMYGQKELAMQNYLLAGVQVVGIILAIIGAFLPKVKE